MPPRAITVFCLGKYPVNHDATKLIGYLVALTGADLCQTRISRGEHRLRAHTQRIGDVRLITVVPTRGALPHLDAGDEAALAPFVAAPGTVLLRGIIATVPPENALWLTLPGAGAIPLVAAEAEVNAALRSLARRWAIVRGVCSEKGIIVHAVQAEADSQVTEGHNAHDEKTGSCVMLP